MCLYWLFSMFRVSFHRINFLIGRVPKKKKLSYWFLLYIIQSVHLNISSACSCKLLCGFYICMYLVIWIHFCTKDFIIPPFFLKLPRKSYKDNNVWSFFSNLTLELFIKQVFYVDLKLTYLWFILFILWFDMWDHT